MKKLILVLAIGLSIASCTKQKECNASQSLLSSRQMDYNNALYTYNTEPTEYNLYKLNQQKDIVESASQSVYNNCK
jgi:hypothetical protein